MGSSQIGTYHGSSHIGTSRGSSRIDRYITRVIPYRYILWDVPWGILSHMTSYEGPPAAYGMSRWVAHRTFDGTTHGLSHPGTSRGVCFPSMTSYLGQPAGYKMSHGTPHAIFGTSDGICYTSCKKTLPPSSPQCRVSMYACEHQLAKREAKEEALRQAELESENERLDEWKLNLGKSLPGHRDKPEDMRDINEASTGTV